MKNRDIDLVKQETEIPKDVLKKLEKSREDILKGRVKQDTPRLKYKISIVIVGTVVAVLALMFAVSPQMNFAIKQVLGISQDAGVASVEESNVENSLNLESTQNGQTIKLTKFVSTKKKFAFDYEFEIKDEKLTVLLEKYIDANENPQFINIGLFSDKSGEDLYSGVLTNSTFRVEGDTFYGSVISTFDQEKIPENSNLTLHIYELTWQDRDEYENKKAAAIAAGPAESFSVDNALEYIGDWSFNVAYKPLPQIQIPHISDITNVSDVQAKSDALQTTATFNAPLKEGVFPAVTIYKDGVIKENFITREMFDPATGKIEVTFNLSALDHSNSQYKLELNEIDANGQPINTIGSFLLQDK